TSLLLRAIISSSLPLLFFHATPTTEIYTLSLHDALPISETHAHAAYISCAPATGKTPSPLDNRFPDRLRAPGAGAPGRAAATERDRKSTRLNSSHLGISYAVFCLKKKKTKNNRTLPTSQN